MRLLLAMVALCAGCTSVSADLEAGTVSVVTFATSRQNIDIGQDADGSIHWRAANSEPDSALAEALLNISRVAVRATGVPVP